MIRLLSLLVPGVCCACLLYTGAQAESKSVGAGADWAKRAAGAKDRANAQREEAEPDATDSGDDSSESTSDTETQAQPAETESKSEPGADVTAEEPSDKTGWTQRVMSPIFSQLVMMSQPVDFVVRFENTKGGSYIREAVPKGETVEDWTQMITVTGLKGATETGQLTPETFFESIAAGFKRACPETFASAPLKRLTVNASASYAAVASCGSVSGGPARSETAAILVIQGTKDFYTLQWAERGEASDEPVDIDTSLWRERLSRLMPVDLCDLDAGKKADCR